MELIRQFKKLTKNDVSLAGGKGASLGEMINAGIPVPDGFVVLSDSFERFIEETDINVGIDAILDNVNTEYIHIVEDASAQIQAIILGKDMPQDIEKEIMNNFKKLGSEFVAVRSSATSEDSASAAWAGQLDTFLNTTKDNVLENVKKCWASLFTPRAIFYRFEQKLNKTKISVAVVVQKMINSEESGIAFSVHPVTKDTNQLIIEAGLGLGEAIVSGQVTQDSYVVDKQDRHIIDLTINEQSKALYRRGNDGGNEWKDLGNKGKEQVLTEKEIIELSKLIIKIENHYGFPCDIEWAKEKGKFHITQSRPITTLQDNVNGDEREKKGDQLDLDEISNLPWSKRWEAPLSLFVIYTGVGGYFEPMKKEIGYSFTKVLIDSKEGTSGCYLLDSDSDDFARVLIKRLKKNPDVLLEWAQKFKDNGDIVRELYKNEPEWFLNLNNYNKFTQDLYIFGVYLVTITQVVDRLTEKQLKKYGSALEESRRYTERIFFDLEDIVNKFLSLIADKEGYSLGEVNACSVEEIQDYLNGSKLPNKKDLKNRHKRSSIYYCPEPILLNSEQADELLGKMVSKSFEGDILKGTGAYKGKIKGKCKVITRYKGDVELKEGEVLVTGMTDPRFVPLMKKSRAIITDAGGVLCHAAIISRELKIPCIVGTKVATQVLKDGDDVEVDADKGVVRILDK